MYCLGFFFFFFFLTEFLSGGAGYIAYYSLSAVYCPVDLSSVVCLHYWVCMWHVYYNIVFMIICEIKQGQIWRSPLYARTICGKRLDFSGAQE